MRIRMGRAAPGGNTMAPTITPITSTPASLGVTPQPALTSSAPAAPAGGNASVATGYNPTPVTGGGTTPNYAAAAAATGGTQQQVRAATTAVSNQFGAPIANDMANAAGGGAISNALQNGVSKIAAFAQNGIKGIQQAIQGDMASSNGQVDPAKMQQYTMQMSTFEMIMQMAAKIQEKQERASQVWLQL